HPRSARGRPRPAALPSGRGTAGPRRPQPCLRGVDARRVGSLDIRFGGRAVSGLIGALADAWAEIRVHKLRVMLSLIGIAVSVGALTAVVAFSEYQQQYQAEQSD